MLPYYRKIIENLKTGKKITPEEGKDIADEFEKFAEAYDKISALVAFSMTSAFFDPVQGQVESKLAAVSMSLYGKIKINGGHE